MNKMNSNLGSDLFIGIDWSGARKGKLPGVSIAVDSDGWLCCSTAVT